MRNRTKKEQKMIDELMGLLVLIAAIIGWFTTNNLTGVFVAVGLCIIVIIIFSIWRSIRFNKKMKESGIQEIDKMTGRQFEEYVGTIFKSQGYKVSYTSTTGDYGADLILKKEQQVIVVQAKRYKQTVGVKAVQEIIPAIKMYNATVAWVITNSTYTKQALILAKKNHVRMIERDELIKMSLDMKNRNVKLELKTD
ncbi:restriction endonuclease [Viridibacillus arvi]|uniref:restriction endonuclease n=1 Tax=Viridibacillus arvi TaxID=263475 RepID=UPI003D07B21F